MYNNTNQHDAMEFLEFLLSRLHEELNTYNIPQKSEGQKTPQYNAHDKIPPLTEWEAYTERNNSVIANWFHGQMGSLLQCLTCGRTSSTYSAFTHLSLPVPIPDKKGKHVQLLDCLKELLKEERLTKGNCWHCPRCKSKRETKKQLTIYHLPPILITQLK